MLSSIVSGPSFISKFSTSPPPSSSQIFNLISNDDDHDRLPATLDDLPQQQLQIQYLKLVQDLVGPIKNFSVQILHYDNLLSILIG